MKGSKCANCQTTLEGEFCHVCGQRDMDMRVAIWRLVVDLAAETFEADGKLFRTLPLFLTQPGKLVRAFVEGRRAHYTSPVRVLVFALAIGFLCLGFGANRSLDRVADLLEDRPFVIENGQVYISTEDSGGVGIKVEPGSGFETKLHKLDGMNQRQAARLLMGGWLDAAATVVLLLIPLFTLVLEALNWRHLVVEHLLLSTLIQAQGLLLVGFAAVTGFPLLGLLAVVWLHGQLLFAMKHVYQQDWRWTIAKWFAAVAAYWFCLAIAFIGAMMVMIYSL